jgi:hypothetical protein
MAATLVPVNPPLLTFGTPHSIGRVGATNDTLPFMIPCESIKYRGNLIIQVVPVAAAGTFSAATAKIQLSLDGGVTFTDYGATSASSIDLTKIQQVDVSGCGGVQAKIVFTTITLGTATALSVWMNVG